MTNQIKDGDTIYMVSVDVENIQHIGLCVYATTLEQALAKLKENLPTKTRQVKFEELEPIEQKLLRKYKGSVVFR